MTEPSPRRSSLWVKLGRALHRGRRILIVGDSALARNIATAVARRPHLGHEVLAVVPCPSNNGACHESLQRHAERMIAEIEARRPNWVILAPRDRRGHLPVAELLRYRVHGLNVDEGLSAYERITGKLAIEALTPGSLLLGAGFRENVAHSIVSRAVSFAAAVVGLLVLAPVLLCVAGAVALDSRGPVFFVQRRVGCDGRVFSLVKFRTMRATRHQRSLWIRDNSDRVTRLGKWLRRFRIDELPQLVNVVRGDMNLVGPRPHPQDNFSLFSNQIPYYWLRGLIRPGLTGWAQVRYGYANGLDEETEKVRYDLFYVKHRNLFLDLQILCATVGVLFGGEGRADHAAQAKDEVSPPAPVPDEASRPALLLDEAGPAAPAFDARTRGTP